MGFNSMSSLFGTVVMFSGPQFFRTLARSHDWVRLFLDVGVFRVREQELGFSSFRV